MNSVDILGFIGTSMILIAFIMNQKHKWEEDYLVYDLSNFIGSGFLVWYAYLIGGYPFIILNAVWSMVSLLDMIKYFKNIKKGAPIVGNTHNIMK